jgi:peptidoglycan/xylan/chitin deacetylase (PgdA/CDA1 family)
MEPGAVRELHLRGHVVGSHSWSHPARISALRYEEILEEWRRSREALEAILDAPVTTASVPGGFYSDLVGQAASDAGVRILFNSEPVLLPRQLGGLQLLGRFNINRRSKPTTAAGLAQRRAHLRLSQYISWNTKKAGKALVGPLYRRLREGILGP